MANIPRNGPAFTLNSTNGTNTYIIGTGSDSLASAFQVHIVNTSSLSASIVVKARSGLKEATDDAVPFVASVYAATYLNGAVSDGTVVSTAITTTSMLLIPATGMQVALDVTHTSGTGRIYVTPIAGASVI